MAIARPVRSCRRDKADTALQAGCTALYPDETAASSSSFQREATNCFQRLGIHTRRVLTDNGPCFYAHCFCDACRKLHITHKRTRIYTSRTNGKTERFIQTAIRK